LSRASNRYAVFHDEFRADLRHWISHDRKIAIRILDLAEAILSDPFSGIGKPEALKFALAGCWSRRITQEHRVVYQVSADRIDFLQARFHYQAAAQAAETTPSASGTNSPGTHPLAK
jgi:toxin YoeB